MKKLLLHSLALLIAAGNAVNSFSAPLKGKYKIKRAPLFLAAALIIGSALMVPLAPAYAAPVSMPIQAAVSHLSDNQTALLIPSDSAAATTAVTVTAQSTMDASTTDTTAVTSAATPATEATATVTAQPTVDSSTTATTSTTSAATPATEAAATVIAQPTVDASATSTTSVTSGATPVSETPAVMPANETAATVTAQSTADASVTAATAATSVATPATEAAISIATELPPPPPPVTTAPADNSVTNSSSEPVAPAPAVAVSTPPAASGTLPPVAQAAAVQSVNNPAPATPYPAASRSHFFPSSDNSTWHFPPPSDNSTWHFPPPSDNSTGHHQPSMPHNWPSQTNPSYPPDNYYPNYPGYPQPQQPVYVPVINSFTASPDYIQSGQAATLSWNVSSASTVTIYPTVGPVANSGSVIVTPTYTTTYTLYADNGQGAVNASAIVTVTPYSGVYGGTPATAVISSFTADPNYVLSGQAVSLYWTVSNADTVTISPTVGPVSNTGSVEVTPAYTTTYALSAYNSLGAVSASTTVTVVPDASSYATPAYAVGNVNSDSTGSGTASGATLNTGQVANSNGNTMNTDGVGSSNNLAAPVNLWPMYLMLIGLAAVASVIITALLVRKPAAAYTQGTGMKTGYTASATTILTATQPATVTPMTTIIEIGLPAKFVSPAGTTMPITGRPLGRRDFRALAPQDKIDTISRQHILVTYENGVYYIEDLGSTNGTRLNGSEIKGNGKHTIESGDTVELAHALTLTFKV